MPFMRIYTYKNTYLYVLHISFFLLVQKKMHQKTGINTHQKQVFIRGFYLKYVNTLAYV